VINRILIVSYPAYLSTKDNQLIVKGPNKNKNPISHPIEDIGVVILEHPQITVTNALFAKFSEYKVYVVHCDNKMMPSGMYSPIVGHTRQSERVRYQVKASVPLKKRLWKQTIQAKLKNQYLHLEKTGKSGIRIKKLMDEVKSGDSTNCEAIAAAYYFKHLLDVPNFIRDREGIPPNNLFNYGYSILRGITARALTCSGLLPTLGIRHQNKYNPFCLADDIMEPYRPFVDILVCDIIGSGKDIKELNREIKSKLLKVGYMDVWIKEKRSPLSVCMSMTTNSIQECFMGECKDVLYPQLMPF